MAEQTGAGHEMRCLEIWGGSGAAVESLAVPGLDLYVLCEPYGGEDAGGDVYLASMCGHGHVTRVVLADVAGHGAGAGPLGHTLRALLRRHIATVDPKQLARELNTAFTRVSRRGRFASALLVTYFAPTDELILVNAGHPPPLLYRAALGGWSLLEAGVGEMRGAGEAADAAVANLPLGVIEPTPYQQIAVRLERDDLLLLYTDALVEAADAGGRPLGGDGLIELLDELDLARHESPSQAIRDALRARSGGRPPGDDLTLVVLHHNAADPATPALGERLRVLGRMLGLGPVETRV